MYPGGGEGGTGGASAGEVDRQACPGARFGNCSSWPRVQAYVPMGPGPGHESFRAAGQAVPALEGKTGLQIPLALSISYRLQGQRPTVREDKVLLCLLQGLLLPSCVPSSPLQDSPSGPLLHACPGLCLGTQLSVCVVLGAATVWWCLLDTQLGCTSQPPHPL